MQLLRVKLAGLLVAALVASGCVPEVQGAEPGATDIAPQPSPTPAPLPEPEPELPLTRRVGDVLESGVLITISLASQQMHVFRDGVLWRSSPVSTGKRGKETPPGVFAILQKKKFHRSNLYSNAPMPFMQRLTWDGIAIHAGALPGYPASHGCIRVPKAFASELFRITGPTSTAVIVVEEALATEAEALALARRTDALVPIAPELLQRERVALARAAQRPAARGPAARTIDTPRGSPDPMVAVALASPGDQTIQLAATLSADLARSHFERLAAQRPDIAAMRVQVIPAVVNGTQYYRLRASAPDAHTTCRALKRAGIDCFPVS